MATLVAVHVTVHKSQLGTLQERLEVVYELLGVSGEINDEEDHGCDEEEKTSRNSAMYTWLSNVSERASIFGTLSPPVNHLSTVTLSVGAHTSRICPGPWKAAHYDCIINHSVHNINTSRIYRRGELS
jgi:hypothetical protein